MSVGRLRGRLLVHEGEQFDQIGGAQIDVHDRAIEFFRNVVNRRCDDDELLGSGGGVVQIAEAAPHFGGIAQGFVEIFQVEDRGGDAPR